MRKEEIDNDINIQEIFYKHIHSIQPNLQYYDIPLLLKEKYNCEKIVYRLSQFNNYKKRTIKNIKFDDKREEMIDSIELNKEKLLKVKIEFQNEKNLKNTIRLYATSESLKLFNDKNISQYFLDYTYKCVPHSNNSIHVLLLIIGFNKLRERFELVSVVTFNSEGYENFKQLYNFLKTNYHFEPQFMTFDFCLANIKAINETFANEDVIIIPCFFHFVQCLWRKASSIGLRKKSNLHKTRVLMINMKILPFLEKDKAIDFYKLIKEEFSEDKYEPFFDYFERTWLNIEDKNAKTKIDFQTWNYTGKFDFKKLVKH